jgi:hypothetical protein
MESNDALISKNWFDGPIANCHGPAQGFGDEVSALRQSNMPYAPILCKFVERFGS